MTGKQLSKWRLFGFVLLTVLLLSGCMNKTEKSVNPSIIEKTRTLKQTLIQARYLNMSYEDYKNTVEDILVDPTYFDAEEILVYNGESYRIADLKGLSDDEFQQLKTYQKEMRHDEIFNTLSITVDISKVYEDPDHNWKIVFARQIDKWEDESGLEHEFYQVNKYMFTEDDDKWKISGVETGTHHYYEGKEEKSGMDSKEEYLKEYLPYTTYMDEPVTYIEKIEFDPMDFIDG
ncbi:MAG: hypothetical protein H0Z33_03240 [Bacillaceae bacterium]|nr:hypothetical protein [Bacillaceae bacterium]